MGVEEEAGPKIVVVEPKPRKGILSAAVDLLERVVVSLTGHSGKPNYYLSGNFAPVSEETPPSGDLKIRGTLPECLNGEFVRVGPNPRQSPAAEYNWFDGDGMIHAVRIKDGKASYVSRYVTTSRLKQEDFFGRAMFMKIGDLKGLFGLFMVYMRQLREKLKIVDVSFGHGTANTALVYHHGKLLALSEGDKPYVVRVLEDGDLQTIGLLDYDKRLGHNLTAHPKVDPFTDELFTFGYGQKPPYVTYRVVTKDGKILDPVPITIQEPVMMHDFAITENYAIFMDLPLYFRPKNMVKNGTLIFTFDPTKKARFGVLRPDTQISNSSPKGRRRIWKQGMGKEAEDDQIASMKEAFSLFDADGDGRIAASELGILMRSLGGNPTMAQIKEIVAEEKLSEPFDFPRFLQLMRKHLKPESFERQLLDAFRVLDKDGSGYVAVADLRHVLTSIGEKLEPAEFDDWIREVDVGSDGNIRYEEFIRRIIAK